MKIKFKKLNKEALIPSRATEGAAAYDLYSIIEGFVMTEGVSIFDTGIAIEIPTGHVGLIFGRSGLAFKNSIQLVNAVAVIDEDYRGSIKIGLVKHDDNSYFHIKRGDRIAQLMILPYPQIEFEEGELSETKRGAQGLGSTGKTVQELLADF